MAIKNFRKVAQQSVSLCPLMSGREKLKTDDLVGQTLTVTAFDIASMVDTKTGELKEFAVYTFAEYPSNYYSAGTVATKIARSWIADETPVDGEYDVHEICGRLSPELAAEQVKFRFTKTTTRAGNNLVAVEVI